MTLTELHLLGETISESGYRARDLLEREWRNGEISREEFIAAYDASCLEQSKQLDELYA